MNFLLLLASGALLTPSRAAESNDQAQVDHAVAVYGQAWLEPESDARAALLAQVWAKDGQYKDPTVSLKGAEALSQHIAGFLQQFPGAQMYPTSRVDFHGTAFRFSWVLIPAVGAPPLEGFDCGERDADGRIVSITGFFGPLPKTGTVQDEAVVTKYLESLFTKFDYAGLDQVLAPDMVYTQATGLPYGGIYHGLPEMMKMFTKSSEYSSMIVVDGPTLSTNPVTKKIIASFTVRCTAKKSGKVLDMAIQESFDVRAGKITGITPFYYDTKTFVEFLNEKGALE